MTSLSVTSNARSREKGTVLRSTLADLKYLHLKSSSRMSEENNACKPFACAIQDCLQKNGYNESKCTKAIDELYKCCKQFYEDNGSDAKSVCCPKFNLLQLKLKQRSLGKIDAELIPHGRR
ncbi:hypothetical protein JCM33374_g2805 [Metschnikowia sp. JCM 33374]|nr:hypothetical protein JCM33374_g2805 [Metschnikowia sp. JCM 33374]